MLGAALDHPWLMFCCYLYCPRQQTAGDMDEGDEPDELDGIMIGKGKGRAPYQVDYTPLSKEDLAAEMKKEINHVASALSLNVSNGYI